MHSLMGIKTETIPGTEIRNCHGSAKAAKRRPPTDTVGHQSTSSASVTIRGTWLTQHEPIQRQQRLEEQPQEKREDHFSPALVPAPIFDAFGNRPKRSTRPRSAAGNGTELRVGREFVAFRKVMRTCTMRASN
jgi:hypothetical protein